MEKKVSFKEKFSNWVSTNKKTLIKLGFWLLYITLLIIFVRYIINKQETNNVNNLENVKELKTMTNYNYECYYNDVFYTGKVTNNTENVYIGDKEYYYDGSWYEVKDEEKIKIEEVLQRLKPEQIYEIIELANYSQTSSKDGLTEITFNISLSNLGYDSDQTINAYIYLSNNEVKGATILGQACAYNKIKE